MTDRAFNFDGYRIRTPLDLCVVSHALVGAVLGSKIEGGLDVVLPIIRDKGTAFVKAFEEYAQHFGYAPHIAHRALANVARDCNDKCQDVMLEFFGPFVKQAFEARQTELGFVKRILRAMGVHVITVDGSLLAVEEGAKRN
jgi:hypothetical protein